MAASVAFLDVIFRAQGPDGYSTDLLVDLVAKASRHAPAATDCKTEAITALDGVFLVCHDRDDGRLPNPVPKALIEAITQLMTTEICGVPSESVLRCGIAYGDVKHQQMPDGSTRLIGCALDEAHRLADHSIANQVLVTYEFRDALGAQWGKGQDYSFEIGPTPLRLLDKYNDLRVCFGLRGLRCDSSGLEKQFGSAQLPKRLWELEIEPPLSAYSPLGFLKTPPEKLIMEHSSLAFVGATNKKLASKVRLIGEKTPTKTWQEILVFFLNAAALEDIVDNSIAGASLAVVREEALADVLKLKSELGDRVESFRLFEFETPYFFASFWDWEKKGGRIHVSPYIWGQCVSRCPAVDYVRKGDRPSSAFEHYVEGLKWLIDNSAEIEDL